MQLIRVAAAVLNQTPLAWDQNLANIREAIQTARDENASLLCLPELCISGYGCEDAFHAAGTWKTSWSILQTIAPETKGIIVSLGLPLLYNHALYNTACLVADGRILGFTAKRFLAGDGIHYEPRWFRAWPLGHHASFQVEGVRYPIGDIHFSCGGVKIGFEICEDAWVANRPGGELALAGADIILNPSASHFAFGKIDVRRRFVLEGSRAFGVSYVYSNLLGNEAGRAIYDGGALIATRGKLLAAGPRFSFANVRVTSAVIDVDLTRMSQARTASFEPDISVNRASCVNADFAFPTVEPETAMLLSESTVIGSTSVQKPEIPEVADLSCPPYWDAAGWEENERIKEEEFSRAMALALFDYLRKSRSHGFVVSLSGGADSAACATLVAVMVKLGVAELSLKEWVKKLGYIPGLAHLENTKQVVHRLLACVYQSTRNSGDVTRNAAREVADFVGAEFFEFDVDAQVRGYIDIVSQAIGREITWQTDDIALQNIQARTRSPGVWMLTNIRNALLLSTSNRSEAAVGYATMDGDTSGGLSPIAGIDKNFLRAWLRWMEATGPSGLGRWPALAAINRQAPTAELRPPAARQTDEDDLMPYDLLDAIERAAIRDKHSPREVFQLMHGIFPQHAPQQLAIWVERFFRLWCRNQWKRERYAPSFHVDDENLDPKTWCRFPILSGGFERELGELRDYVAKAFG